MSSIHIEIYRNAPILKVAGTFQVAQSREFAELVRYFIEAGRRLIVLDLTVTEEIQSAGLAAISAACRQMEAKGGRLVLVAPAGNPGFADGDHISGGLIVFETMAEAKGYLAAQNGDDRPR